MRVSGRGGAKDDAKIRERMGRERKSERRE